MQSPTYPTYPAPPSPSSPAPPASSVASSRRLGTVVLMLALALSTMLAALLASTGAARAEAPSSVTVEDTVGVVDPEALASELQELDLRRPVDLHILVLDVRDHGLDPADDTALNDAVLAHARDDGPQLLSFDGEHWADGLVVLAIDPEGRLLGTYAGEDVKLSDGGFETVQDDMRDPAAEGQWEEAFTEGARTYAALLGRPWWQHPGTIVIAVLAVGGLLITVASLLAGRRGARRRVDQARPRHDDVMATRRLTDTAARNLPDHSPYTPAARHDHDRYSAQLTEVEELHAQLPPAHRRGWGWGLRGAQRRLARDFAATVAELDDLDDDIIATHDLLHRIGDWRGAWEREIEPLRDAVASLDEIDADLHALGERISAEIDDLTARLEADSITPDAALEGLDELTEELSAAVTSLRDRQVGTLAEDEEEAELLREVEVDPEDHGEPTYRSVRERRQALAISQGAGISAVGTAWHLNPVLWYSLWHTESGTALESHRNPAAAAGSTSGYSAGGFSGAGSSSSF